MAFSISEIFRKHFDAYAARQRLPRHQRRAAWLIARCGRSELGGHLERCACAQTERIVWHSCKHRLCPRCARKVKDEWLEKETARLLPCAHQHIIFTMPHELLDWWRYNRAAMADALFDAAAQTLTELLGDPRYLGACPGMLLALHTWSRSMALHPHIHALVTDGGLVGDVWRTPRRSHFLPAGVVKALFRGKFLAALSRLLVSGDLQLPPDVSPERARSLINRLGRLKWHVWLCTRYAHGQGVLLYLARYLRGGPLRDSQLVSVSNQRIVIRYRPHGAPPTTLSLDPGAWLRRYLEHAPVLGQHALRRYGLYAPAAHVRRQLARSLVAPAPARLPRRSAIHPKPTVCCLRCAQPLRFTRRIPPQRSPP
ncbi:MAG: transposase [Gallionella sp.]